MGSKPIQTTIRNDSNLKECRGSASIVCPAQRSACSISIIMGEVNVGETAAKPRVLPALSGSTSAVRSLAMIWLERFPFPAFSFPQVAFWHHIMVLYVQRSICASKDAELLGGKHAWPYCMRVPNGQQTAPPSGNFGRLSLLHQQFHRDTKRPHSR